MLITVVLADDNEDHRTAVRFVLELAGDLVAIVGEAVVFVPSVHVPPLSASVTITVSSRCGPSPTSSARLP